MKIDKPSAASARLTRRGFLGAAGGVAAAALLPLPARGERPNFLVIMTDDVRYDDVGHLPNLRRLLVAQGTSFSRNYVAYSKCGPSRASFLSGQHTHNNHVEHNQGAVTDFDHNDTLPVWLQAVGYRTALQGKYINGYGQGGDWGPTRVPPGYTDWYATIDPTTYFYYNYKINHNGQVESRGDQESDYCVDDQAIHADQLIRDWAGSGQPWYINYSPVASHEAMTAGQGVSLPIPPNRYQGRFADLPFRRRPDFNEADVSDKPKVIRDLPLLTDQQIADIEKLWRARLETLLAVDDAIGRFYRTLQETGQLANTLIIFTSDNGFFLGEHRVPHEKTYAYEVSTRMPLIVRGPGVPAGQVRHGVTSSLDITETIVDLAGATPTLATDGASLVPYLKNPKTGLDRAVLTEARQSSGEQNPDDFEALRTTGYRLIHHNLTDEWELYDLHRDPYELTNVYGDPAYAKTQQTLNQTLNKLANCAGDSCVIDAPRSTKDGR